MKRNQKGLSGISTLIIFIAIILVAAVAALVLLQTVSTLQSQALATGKQSKAQVSTKLQIESIIGYVPGTNLIDYLRITARLAPGSGKIGLSDTTLSYTDGANIQTGIAFDDTTTGGDGDNTETLLAAYFDAQGDGAVNTIYDIRWLGESRTYDSGDISAGQLVEFWYDAPDIAVSTDIELGIHPDVGSPAEVFLKTPSSYDDNYVALYP